MTYTMSFCEYDIKWIPLLCQKENIDSYKKVLFARLQVEFSERSYGYLQDDRPTNGSLQSKGISNQSKNNYLSGISNGTLYMMQNLTHMWQG
jgi:hypothetical protein